MKQPLAVAGDGGGGEGGGDEPPVGGDAGGDGAAAFDGFHEIVAEVESGAADYALFEPVDRDACAACEQFAATVGAVGVDGHGVGALEAERGAVGHGEDVDFSALRLTHVHFVVYAES